MNTDLYNDIWPYSDDNMTQKEIDQNKRRFDWYKKTLDQLRAYLPTNDREFYYGVFKTYIYRDGDETGNLNRMKNYLLGVAEISEADKATIRQIPTVYPLSEDEKKERLENLQNNQAMDETIQSILAASTDQNEARYLYSRLGNEPKAWAKIISWIEILARNQILPVRSTIDHFMKSANGAIRNNF